MILPAWGTPREWGRRILFNSETGIGEAPAGSLPYGSGKIEKKKWIAKGAPFAEVRSGALYPAIAHRDDPASLGDPTRVGQANPVQFRNRDRRGTGRIA